jgi:aminopeptidase N
VKKGWAALCLALISLALATGCGPLPAPGDPLDAYRPALLPAQQGDLAALAHLPRYAILLDVDAAAQRVSGEEQVLYRNLDDDPLESVVLRLYPNLKQNEGQMRVTEVTVNGRAVKPELAAEGTALRVPLPSPLRRDEAVTLSLAFDVEVPSRGQGRILFGVSQGIWSLSTCYPILAVRDGTGWREDIAPPHADPTFSEMALYEVVVRAPSEFTVAASGSTVAVEEGEGGMRVWHIAGGPLREFGLLLGDFHSAGTEVGGTAVTSYYRERDRAAGLAALWHTAAALRAYSLLFGPYPYAELDVVEAPLGRRGQEYPGLIQVGSDLYGDEREDLEYLVAHETAHQWWYNLVGSDPWKHPWLDEALAEYATYDYYRLAHGDDAAGELLEKRWQASYDYVVERGRDGAVDRPARAFDEESYHLLVYDKGALFLDALRREVGDEAYLAVLRTYLAEQKYGIATPQRFLAVANRVTGRDLNRLAEKWLR